MVILWFPYLFDRVYCAVIHSKLAGIVRAHSFAYLEIDCTACQHILKLFSVGGCFMEKFILLCLASSFHHDHRSTKRGAIPISRDKTGCIICVVPEWAPWQGAFVRFAGSLRSSLCIFSDKIGSAISAKRVTSRVVDLSRVQLKRPHGIKISNWGRYFGRCWLEAGYTWSTTHWLKVCQFARWVSSIRPDALRQRSIKVPIWKYQHRNRNERLFNTVMNSELSTSATRPVEALCLINCLNRVGFDGSKGCLCS